jgi:hypothetical protein
MEIINNDDDEDEEEEEEEKNRPKRCIRKKNGKYRLKHPFAEATHEKRLAVIFLKLGTQYSKEYFESLQKIQVTLRGKPAARRKPN